MPRLLPPRKTVNLSESLHRRLNMYSAAASAAGVSVLALAGASDAKIVYTKTHQVTRTGVPLYIDLNHDGIKDFVLRTTFYVGTAYLKVGLDASSAYHGTKNAIAGRRFSRSGYFFSAASALEAGAPIGPKREVVHRPFMAEELFPKDGGSSHYSDLGPWVGKGKGVSNRYLGLKFVVQGKVHYGWARLSVRLGHHRQYDDVRGTLTGYAYETIPNKPIIAGETEGPDVVTVKSGSLGALAAGKK